jgi:hypothetical protein
MVSDGIKAARIQARYSTLNSSWGAGSFRTANVVSAVKHAAARLKPHWGGRKHAGRHVAPGRTIFSRHVPR